MMRGELQFAMTEQTSRRIEEVLFPEAFESGPPERGIIVLVTRSSGDRRQTLILREVVEPADGDVVWSDEGLVFSPAYKSRAVDTANELGCGLCFVHTHPTQRAPVPSDEDLHGDALDLFHLGQALSEDAPLAAGIMSDSRRWSLRQYVFKYPKAPKEAREREFSASSGKMRYADAYRVVGPSLRKYLLSTSTGALPVDVAAHDSSIRLWGAAGQARLGSLRVAIVGLGGVGGILAEHIARLGVGELLLIDFDRLSVANKNRSQGATIADVRDRALKVDVGERSALQGATSPNFAVRTDAGSIVQSETVRLLLDCDLILNGADSPWARQVLDHIAFAHLIPVINGGTELRGNPVSLALVAGKSEVAVTGPGHPCFECAGVYSFEDASTAREHPSVRGARAYAKAGEVEVRSPSVISANALVAGLMQLRMLGIALGTTPNMIVGTQRYHFLEGTMDLAVCSTCHSTCERALTTGLGDLHLLPLGVDRDFEVAQAKKV